MLLVLVEAPSELLWARNTVMSGTFVSMNAWHMTPKVVASPLPESELQPSYPKHANAFQDLSRRRRSHALVTPYKLHRIPYAKGSFRQDPRGKEADAAKPPNTHLRPLRPIIQQYLDRRSFVTGEADPYATVGPDAVTKRYAQYAVA